MTRRSLVDIGVSLALLAFAAPASAQDGDPAKAHALFDEATQSLDKGNWDVACPMFDASFTLKRTVSALLNIAKCHAHAGKLTLAADDYHRALSLNEDTVSQSRKSELADYTNDALRTLEARIPKLRITLEDPPAGLSIVLDDHALPAASLNIDLPVDPGEHLVVVSAPGRKTDTRRATLAEGNSADLAMALAPEITAPIAAAPAAPAAMPVAPAPPLPPPDRPTTPVQRGGVPAWAWVGGAAGVAFGAAAVVFAVNGAGANCGGACTDDKFTQSDVNQLNARRHRDLGLGLAFGGLGAIGLAIGVAGIATAPRARSTTGFVVHVWTGSGVAGLGLRGEF